MALTEAELKNHTVAQLKTLLTERELPTDGLKAVLLARLLEHESSSAANGSAAPAAPADASSDAKPAASSTPAPAAAPAPATASAPASSSAPAQTAEEKAAADEAKRQARAAKFGAVPDAEKPSLNGELAGGRRAKDKAAAPASAPKEPAAKKVPDLDKPLGEGKRGKAAKADAPAPAAAAKPAVDPAVAAAEEEKKRKRAERFGAPDAAADAKRPKV